MDAQEFFLQEYDTVCWIVNDLFHNSQLSFPQPVEIGLMLPTFCMMGSGGFSMSAPSVNLWPSPEHALEYLRRADSIPHRVEGESTLLEFLPAQAKHILDLGSGGGRLLELVKAARPDAEFVGLDFSPTMLQELRKIFAKDSRVRIVEHDLDRPLPPMGRFDAIISSFAIHHVSHERKRAL